MVPCGPSVPCGSQRQGSPLNGPWGSLGDEGCNRLAAVTVLNFGVDLKRLQTPHILFWDFGADKILHPVGQAAEFKFESEFQPLNHARRLFKFQQIIKGFYCKINGRALGAALRHSLGWSDGRAQTQGISESAAAATGTLEKNMLPLLRRRLASAVLT